MAAATAAVLGAGLSYMAANQARKSQEDAMGQQQAMQEAQMAEARRQYEEEQKYIRPVREQLTREATSGQPLDYARTAAQIKKQYADIYRNLSGNNSGLGASAIQAANLSRSSALADAYGRGLEKTRALQMGLLGHDKTAQYGGQLTGAMGRQADYYGQMAGQYGQAAQAGWQGVAQGVGQLGSLYGQGYFNRETPVTSTSTVIPDTTSAMPIAPAMQQNAAELAPYPTEVKQESSFIGDPTRYSIQPDFYQKKFLDKQGSQIDGLFNNDYYNQAFRRR